MNRIEQDSAPKLIESMAHIITNGLRKLLTWPNRGKGVPRLATPAGAAVIFLAIMSISAPAFAQINVEEERDQIRVNGLCSLREAILNANNGAGGDLSGGDCEAGNAGVDVINLPDGTYRVSIAGAGEDAAATGDFDILEDLTINGGNPQPTIQGSRDRIFDILGTSSFILDNVELTRGDANGAGAEGNGGGIRAGIGTTVTVQNKSVIMSSKANNHGGGIYCTGCTLNVTDSFIQENEADDASIGGTGGGIYIDGGGAGILNLTDSVIGGATSGEKNTAFNGGGLAIGDDVGVTIIRSSIVSNEAENDGGGIHDSRSTLGTVLIVNSTISGNIALNDGGGMFINDTIAPVQSTSTTIKNVTITKNIADENEQNGGEGGGIRIVAGGLTLVNVILAENVDPTSEPDCSKAGGIIDSLGNNIVGDNSGCVADFPAGLPNANNDLVGTAGSPVDPRLEALATNPPGTTPSHMLFADSPAIDAGDNTTCEDGDVNDEDQRTSGRPKQFNGVDICDIGAIELNRFERTAETESQTVKREFQVPFNCGIDQTTINNMGNEFISKEKHETYIKITHPQTRSLTRFLFGTTPASIVESLTINNPANFQVPGVMSPFALLRLNPGKTVQISCTELLEFPTELDGDGNIDMILLDELGDPDTFFQGTLFLQTNNNDVQVSVHLVTQTWTATPPLGGGSPAEFTGGERLVDSFEVESVSISGRQPYNFRVVQQGDPTTVTAASAGMHKYIDDNPKPGFVQLSSSANNSIQFKAQGLDTAQLEVQVYSLTGKLIFDAAQNGNTLSWNMRNISGQRMANGVYLYVVTSRGADGKIIRSGVKKLVVMR